MAAMSLLTARGDLSIRENIQWISFFAICRSWWRHNSCCRCCRCCDDGRIIISHGQRSGRIRPSRLQHCQQGFASSFRRHRLRTCCFLNELTPRSFARFRKEGSQLGDRVRGNERLVGGRFVFRVECTNCTTAHEGIEDPPILRCGFGRGPVAVHKGPADNAECMRVVPVKSLFGKDVRVAIVIHLATQNFLVGVEHFLCRPAIALTFLRQTGIDQRIIRLDISSVAAVARVRPGPRTGSAF
mmetsp:Transcript_9633/g.27413  ORF Transcript_9633/g.27413 Transcript_9633/m.27413 type:complete len:242 (-) Transcript_9633:1124-1849(-)